MNRKIFIVLAVATVTSVITSTDNSVLSQDTACYIVDESGNTVDLSEMCGSAEEPSPIDRTEEAAILTERARKLASAGYYDEALKLTDEVLSIAPDFAEVYVYRGSIRGLLSDDLSATIEEYNLGAEIFERRGDLQRAEIMRAQAANFQDWIDSGQWAEALEEERRIAAEAE